MTDAGNHDTFVAIGATGGVPGGGEIPMMTARNCQSVRGIKHYHKLLFIKLLRKKRTFDG
jgi:hypothetical protein